MYKKSVDKVTSEYQKVKHPDFKVGDIIDVHTKIKEDGKERVQVFTGIVISIKGIGVSKTFTVRKISYGIGVEKIFPYYSPIVKNIKIVKRASKIRRSKLYYLRKRLGKTALKAGVQIPAEGEDLETRFEDSLKEEAEETEVKDEEKKERKEEKKDVKKEDNKKGDSEVKQEKDGKNTQKK